MEGERPAGDGATVYCIVPRDLAGRVFDPLREHFREDPEVEVIVEQRRGERRRGERRGKEPGPPPGEERRAVRSETGRRVADRRALTVPVGPPRLPLRARRHADRLVFVERIEAADQRERDVEADRLILRYQAGEDSALGELYLRYFNTVYGYARVALREHHEAEDVTQHVFANVIRAAPDYEVRSGTPCRAWLLQITRNVVIDATRKKRKLVLEDPARVARRADETASGAGDVLEWLSDKDVSLFIERLPETQREVLVLRFMLDLSVTEVAELMGKSEAATRKVQERALRSLEQRLLAIGRTPLRSRRVPTLIRIKPAPVLAARRFSLQGSFSPAGRLVAAATRFR